MADTTSFFEQTVVIELKKMTEKLDLNIEIVNSNFAFHRTMLDRMDQRLSRIEGSVHEIAAFVGKSNQRH